MLFKLAFACSVLSVTMARPSATPNFWFSFGDSYTETKYTVNGTQPTIGNPMGNPPYPGLTTTGGTNWIDVDSTVYNKSLILTYNYAFGGATIDSKLVTPYMPTVLSLTDQINEFLSKVGNKPAATPWTSANAIFSIWIGINDIGNSWNQTGDRSADVGARNFLFLNVPPVDRSPSVMRNPVSSQITERNVINTHNDKYAAKISAFKASHPGVATYLWDSHAVFTAILNNPTAYGFSDATSYGGAKSFWWNDYHPASGAHTIFAKDIATLLRATRF